MTDAKSSGLGVHGSMAAHAARLLPADLPVLAVDHTGLASGYIDAVKRRERGETFFAMICVDDQRSVVAYEIASQIMATGRLYDERRQGLTELASRTLRINNTPVDDFVAVTNPQMWILRDIAGLADGIWVRSQEEFSRLCTYLGFEKPRYAVVPLEDPQVPRFERAAKPAGIVVWAPSFSFALTAIHRFALEEMRLPVSIVCEGETVRGLDGAILPQTPREALHTASVIVDTAVSDPSAAIAFAHSGVPLVATRTSGAHEAVQNLHVYKPLDWRSLYNAVAAALAAPAPRLVPVDGDRLARGRETIADAAEMPPFDGPLVSLIMPTYNRRHVLAGALRDVFSQFYEALECVVVNDGGEDVADIVAQFPKARLVSYEQNGGPEHAINIGIRASKGAYIGLIPDDDLFYPDHIARLVDACERSGCGIAHGNILIRYLLPEGDAIRVEGFSARTFAFALDKTEALVTSPVAGHGFLARRAIFDELGVFDEELPALADQEIQGRFSRKYDFVHVDRFTGEWRFSGGEENFSSRKAKIVPDACRMMFAKLPVTDRPLVEALRQSMLQNVESRPPGFRFDPVIALTPQEAEAWPAMAVTHAVRG